MKDKIIVSNLARFHILNPSLSFNLFQYFRSPLLCIHGLRWYWGHLLLCYLASLKGPAHFLRRTVDQISFQIKSSPKIHQQTCTCKAQASLTPRSTSQIKLFFLWISSIAFFVQKTTIEIDQNPIIYHNQIKTFPLQWKTSTFRYLRFKLKISKKT